MRILAIETSCDETAVAVLECTGDLKNPRFTLLGNALLSQALQHAPYGGVYPNLAKRLHQENLIPMLTESLTEAGMLTPSTVTPNDSGTVLDREPYLRERVQTFLQTHEKPPVDYIAVTHGPGLEPALWVGLNFAKALSLAWNIPLIPVNHMEGHIVSVLFRKGGDDVSVTFPALAFLISGGHTQLVLVKEWGMYEIIGETRDDAIGEAFDKAARVLGLPYPGGPQISQYADAFRKRGEQQTIQLPRPMIDSPNYDFSFSGLKTAVLYLVKNLGALDQHTKEAVACAFEDAVVAVCIEKVRKALSAYDASSFIVGGGVIANKALREAFDTLMKEFPNTTLYIPEMMLTTDNAIMIGMAGYIQTLTRKNTQDVTSLAADGTLSLTQ